MSSAMDAHLESASTTIAQLRSDPHLSKDGMQQLFSQLRIQIAAAEQAIEAEKELFPIKPRTKHVPSTRTTSPPTPTPTPTHAQPSSPSHLSCISNLSPVPAFKAALERRIDALHQHFDFEAAAKPSAKQNGLAKLRRAHEAVAIEAAKLDKLNTELLNVANYDWATWSQAGLASAVVSVSVGLWDLVDVGDLGGSSQQVLEFGEYLKNVATAAVLMDTEEENVVRQSQTVESIVAVAYILFYVYRDLGSSLSLLQSLEDACITRLSSVWDLVSKECKSTLSSLKDLLTDDEPLSLLQDLLTHHYRGPYSHITVLPALPPLLTKISNIYKEYTIDTTTTPPLLSEPGTQSLTTLLSTIHACLGSPSAPYPLIDPPYKQCSNPTPLPPQPSFYTPRDPGPSAHPNPWSTDPKQPFHFVMHDDLRNLPHPDAFCVYWIVTRGTVSEEMLWTLSFECVPKRDGEVGFVPSDGGRDGGEEEDGGWSDREDDDDDDGDGGRVRLSKDVIAKVLEAGRGDAAPIPGVGVNVGGTGGEEGDVDAQALLAGLEGESWDDNDDNENVGEEDEYEKRKKALEALFPVAPVEEPKGK